jgi:hypothetical protein
LTDHDPGTAFTEVPYYWVPATMPPTTGVESVAIPTSGQNLGLIPDGVRSTRRRRRPVASALTGTVTPALTGLESVLIPTVGQNLGMVAGPEPGPEPGPGPGAPGAPPVFGVFGQTTGDLQIYSGGTTANGAPIEAWVESRHFTDELTPAKILAVPIFATGTGTLVVQLRAAMDARQPLPPWPLTPPTSARLTLDAVQTRPWIDVRAYGRIYQIRLESTGLRDQWAVSAYGTARVPGGFVR